MAIERGFEVSRVAKRLMLAAGAAALIAGCSDASRFSGDPFSDPFTSSKSVAAKGVDRAPTGSVATIAAPPLTPGRVESRPLPAPGAPAAARPMPAAPATPSAAPSSISGSHWSPEGGTPIVVAQGETAGMIATRYGVPPDVLLRVNGFSSSQQVQPGARLVIPVFRAGAAPALRPTPPAPIAAARPVTEKPAPAKPAAAKPEPKAPANKSVKTEQDVAPTTKPARKGADARGADKAKTAMVAAAEKPAEAAPAAKPVDKATTTASIPPAAQEEKTVAADGRPEFRWPARGRIIQGFTSGGNDGINIAVPEGTQVKAAEGGVVAYAGSELKGYGNLVLIRHSNGFVSAYAHNGALEVKRGDQVKRGQTIAKSGQSGNVGSPQLHFELRKGSTPVDPTSYLAGS